MASSGRLTALCPAASATVLSIITGFVVGSALIIPILSWSIIVLAIAVPLIAKPVVSGRAKRVLGINYVTLAALFFTIWAGISALWAPNPVGALKVSGILLAVVLLTHLACRLVAELERENLRALAIGVVAAMLIAGAFLVVETWTNQAVGRFLFSAFPVWRGSGDHMVIQDSRVEAIGDIVMNRRVCIWMLLFWPTVALSLLLFADRTKIWVLAGLALTVLAIVPMTTHKSSILAFAISACVGAVWKWAPRGVVLLTGASWCAAVLLVVPITGTLYDSGLSQNPKLFHSARERVALWGYTAHQVNKHPFIGFGANAVRETDVAIRSAGESGVSSYVASRPGFHSHNFYLQVWYELGAFGAIAFLAMGLAGLLMMTRRDQFARQLILTEFVTISAMIATNYGLWQFWFQAAIASSIMLSTLCCVFARRLARGVLCQSNFGKSVSRRLTERRSAALWHLYLLV